MKNTINTSIIKDIAYTTFITMPTKTFTQMLTTITYPFQLLVTICKTVFNICVRKKDKQNKGSTTRHQQKNGQQHRFESDLKCVDGEIMASDLSFLKMRKFIIGVLL